MLSANFSGARSVGWYDTSTNKWNEKFDVDVMLKNNTVGWEIFRGPASGNGNTFGYGVFDVKIDAFAGQTGFLIDGGTQRTAVFSYSTFHLTVNLVSAPADALRELRLKTPRFSGPNVYMIHMEAPFGMGSGQRTEYWSRQLFRWPRRPRSRLGRFEYHKWLVFVNASDTPQWHFSIQ